MLAGFVDLDDSVCSDREVFVEDECDRVADFDVLRVGFFDINELAGVVCRFHRAGQYAVRLVSYESDADEHHYQHDHDRDEDA